MNQLVIIGAGGHGKVIADIAMKNDYTNIVFIDDYNTGECMGFPILGGTAQLKNLNNENTDFIIAIGSNTIRRKIVEENHLNWVKLIHPSAQISFGAEIGNGTVVMAGAIINAGAVIGNHCIINSGSVIEHDNQLSDYVHISPNAVLGGTVRVGRETHIGIGAVIKNNVTIGQGILIGAGAVVVNSIIKQGTYIGIPAHIR